MILIKSVHAFLVHTVSSFLSTHVFLDKPLPHASCKPLDISHVYKHLDPLVITRLESMFLG